MTARVIQGSDPEAIEEVAAAIVAGDLVALPTETVYGLAALPDEQGVARLIAAKQRSAEKGIQLLVDSIEQAETLVDFSPVAEALAEAFWPGGLTIVAQRRADSTLPDLIGGGRPTVGVRLPDHEVPRAICQLVGPICASSANVTGEPAATDAEQVARTLGEELSLIVDDGPVRGGVASTVVDCSDPTRPPIILREGAIPAADIEEVASAAGMAPAEG